jgi:DNA primase
MPNPGDFASTVKQQADIIRIIGEYVKLRKAGAQNYQGLCPFHQEKTPSFSVHATNQFFHCFGCKASGDVFSFVQKIENITFPESVRLIADKLGIAVPKMQYASEEEARQARQRGGLLDINERACVFFQEQLRKSESAHAREYLKSRGLTPEIIAEFRIGFAPERGFVLRDVLSDQFGEELMRESGLFSWKEKDQPPAASEQNQLSVVSGQLSEGSAAPMKPATDNRQLTSLYSKFRNRIMFPITNEQGKVIAFTGRTLAVDEKSGPKYLNSPETPIYSKSRVLFNIDKAKQAIRQLDYAVLVEGQMDCISVYAAGFKNVIASSGTAFTEPQARLLGRFSKNVVVNFDPDTAGAAAAERSLTLLVSEDFQIKVLTLETGFDPDLYVRKKGKDAYADVLHHSARYFDYLIERARGQFPFRTPEGKVKAVNFLLPHVQRVPSRIARDELANEISHRLGIESSVLRQELRRAATARRTQHVTAPSNSGCTDAERVLIRALASRDLAQTPISQREGQDLGFEAARQAHFALRQEPLHAGCGAEDLINALLTGVEEGADPMSLSLTDDQRALLASTLMHANEELTPELLESALRSLKRRHQQQELEQLQRRVKELEAKEDLASRAQLAQERLRLKQASRAVGDASGP